VARSRARTRGGTRGEDGRRRRRVAVIGETRSRSRVEFRIRVATRGVTFAPLARRRAIRWMDRWIDRRRAARETIFGESSHRAARDGRSHRLRPRVDRDERVDKHQSRSRARARAPDIRAGARARCDVPNNPRFPRFFSAAALLLASPSRCAAFVAYSSFFLRIKTSSSKRWTTRGIR